MLAVVEWIRQHAPDFIATSPTTHARALAQGITRGVDSMPEPTIDDGWCEVDHGAWEGLRHEEVRQRFGSGAAKRFEDPQFDGHGGETLLEIDARVGCTWESLLTRAGRVAAVVSHATPIRLVLCQCLDLPISMQWRLRIDNSSVTRVDVDGKSAVIGFVNRRAQA